jgi:hypothetical protein
MTKQQRRHAESLTKGTRVRLNTRKRACPKYQTSSGCTSHDLRGTILSLGYEYAIVQWDGFDSPNCELVEYLLKASEEVLS